MEKKLINEYLKINNWKKIWNKNDKINKITLEMLIKADGFDSGVGSFKVDDWLEYVNIFYKKLNIQKDNSIYDVGCGSSVFIYPLYLKNPNIVGWGDYSMALIDLANTIMPNSDFTCDEAINIDVNKKYDFVVSNGVFHYFENLDYAKNIVKKMLQKSNKKIAIFDINDKTKELEYHNIRIDYMDRDEYKKKYEGLEHMFYTKDWFKNIAKEFNLKIDIFDQSFENYKNSKLRFNVIMEKK